MFDLTEAQQRVLNEHHEYPPQVRDPRTNEVYVLIPVPMYERVAAILDEEDEIEAIREMYPLVSEVLDADEADDPPTQERA